MLLTNLYRSIFCRHQEREAAPVNVVHRIQRVCVMTAVEFQRQTEVIRGQRERLAAEAQS
jgi:hypothetical protein